MVLCFKGSNSTSSSSFKRRTNNGSIKLKTGSENKVLNKTPERAEFELNIENRGDFDEYDEEDDECDEDDDYDSQQNTSSGFLSKSVSEQTSNIDLEELESQQNNNDESDEEEDDEDDDGERDEQVDEIEEGEEEAEEEEEEEEEETSASDENINKNENNMQRPELLNKKTDNLLLKLKLANNLINWEANM